MLAYNYCRLNDLEKEYKEWLKSEGLNHSNLNRLNFIKTKYTFDFLGYVLNEYENLESEKERLSDKADDYKDDLDDANRVIEEHEEELEDSIIFTYQTSVYDRMKIDELKRIFEVKSLDELKKIE